MLYINQLRHSDCVIISFNVIATDLYLSCFFYLPYVLQCWYYPPKRTSCIKLLFLASYFCTVLFCWYKPYLFYVYCFVCGKIKAWIMHQRKRLNWWKLWMKKGLVTFSKFKITFGCRQNCVYICTTTGQSFKSFKGWLPYSCMTDVHVALTITYTNLIKCDLD